MQSAKISVLSLSGELEPGAFAPAEPAGIKSAIVKCDRVAGTIHIRPDHVVAGGNFNLRWVVGESLNLDICRRQMACGPRSEGQERKAWNNRQKSSADHFILHRVCWEHRQPSADAGRFARPSLKRYRLGFAREVGKASAGFSGQGCFGYRPRMSRRTSA